MISRTGQFPSPCLGYISGIVVIDQGWGAKACHLKASLFIARLRNGQSGLDYLTQYVWLVHPSLF